MRDRELSTDERRPAEENELDAEERDDETEEDAVEHEEKLARFGELLWERERCGWMTESTTEAIERCRLWPNADGGGDGQLDVGSSGELHSSEA